eukprot:785877_1
MHFSLMFVLLFHTQSSYFLGPDPLIFSEAEAYCVSQSSHLASVHSSSEFYEARSLCETVTNPQACWTGLERVGLLMFGPTQTEVLSILDLILVVVVSQYKAKSLLGFHLIL